MKTRTKRWIAATAAVLGLGFAGLNVLAYNHARAMTEFSAGGERTRSPEDLSLPKRARILIGGVNVPRPRSPLQPSDLAPDTATLAVGVGCGIVLEAWYCGRGVETPLALLFHGYAADKTSLLAEARTLLDMGASVMLVDFRGSGGSSASYTTIGVHEAEDVAAVVGYAERNLNHSGTVLFGQSMGAAAVLKAIRDCGVRPDAVILEAVFDTMTNTVRNRFRAMRAPSFPSAELLVFWGGRHWGFSGFGHNPAEYAEALYVPALFMHGQNDPRARPEEGRRVYDAAAGPKAWVAFPDCGHESYVASDPGLWRTAVEAIIGGSTAHDTGIGRRERETAE